MTYLLDGNVLVALTLESHVHHSASHRWFASKRRKFATCATTQGTLIRVHMAAGTDRSARAAWRILASVIAMPGHSFWDGAPGYDQVRPEALLGAKQVTDAWLAMVARRHHAKIATFDVAAASLHEDVAELIPS